MANIFDNSDITDIFLNIIAVTGSVPSCAASVPRNNAATAFTAFTEYFSVLRFL